MSGPTSRFATLLIQAAACMHPACHSSAPHPQFPLRADAAPRAARSDQTPAPPGSGPTRAASPPESSPKEARCFLGESRTLARRSVATGSYENDTRSHNVASAILSPAPVTQTATRFLMFEPNVLCSSGGTASEIKGVLKEPIRSAHLQCQPAGCASSRRWTPMCGEPVQQDRGAEFGWLCPTISCLRWPMEH